MAAEYGTFSIGFPRIGQGLAGGDKDRIIAMLEDFAEQVSATGGTVTLVEFG
jgi:O-acetyl-ADP-ribose deacetylase (regulator of RNase III)